MPNLSKFSDEALIERKANALPLFRGEIRECEILLEVLTDPADRFEAVCRAGGIQNRCPMRWSDAVQQAALSIRDGAPRFRDEFHPTCPTAPVR